MHARRFLVAAFVLLGLLLFGSPPPLPAAILLVSIDPSTVDVTEGGATDTYSVVLLTEPTANVVIAISPDSQETVNSATLTFTPSDYSTAQYVTVTAVDDVLVEGFHNGTISHSATSDDSDYDGSLIADVTVNITDNDIAQMGPVLVVTTADDHDDTFCTTTDCTLREAINAANGETGANTITFDIPFITGCTSPNHCTITLGALGSLPAIDDDLTIDGSANGADITLTSTNGASVMLINGGNLVTLETLTIANSTCNCLGVVRNKGGTLNVRNSTFSGNHPDDPDSPGGAILNVDGTLNVFNSTFSGNTANESGGAIHNNDILNVTNSTFSGNTSGHGGTISSSRTATLKNTIIVDSTGGADCAVFHGTLSADAFNMDSDGSCNNATQTTTTQIALAALADNGGPTQTMALGSSSAAIDAGDPTVCADANTINNLDQRGEPRNDLRCDIGAFEFVNSDGHTVNKTFDADNNTLTFGPTLAQMLLVTGSPLTLDVNRELPGTRPGTPPANALPITWDATTQTVEFDLLITLCYDPTGLTPTYESSLHVWHYNGSTWDDLGGTLDTATHAPYHCVTATTALTSLSPLILAPAAPTSNDVTGVKGLVNKNGNIVLRWKTTSESQIAGFNIYRQGKQGEWKQLNANLRQAKHAGAALGDKYRFIDRQANADKTYRYKIEIVFLDGHREWTNVIRVNRK